MAKSRLSQVQREALAELIGTLSEAPRGEFLAGRAFEMLRDPMYQLILDIAGENSEEIIESINELKQVRAQVRGIGI